MIAHQFEKQSLIDIGSLFYQRAWSMGTSSNYSIKLRDTPLKALITASGKDKRGLLISDFVEVDDRGKRIGEGDNSPSAETMLHVVALQQPGMGAVLHTHSVWSTILSDRYAAQARSARVLLSAHALFSAASA